MATIAIECQTDDLTKSAISRAVLLVIPVTETLQRRLTEHFPLLRFYEQGDPIVFLREQGENVAVVATRSDVGVANSVLELLSQVGLTVILGVGTDAMDLACARSRQIAVTITSGVLTSDIAGLAVGLLLAGSRQLYQGDRFVHEERWLSGDIPLVIQVSGERVGLLGMGNIGQAITRRARGLDMQVLYTDHKKIAGPGYQWCTDPHTLVHEGDFLVIAVSGGGVNRGATGASVSNVVPTHARLVNIVRGSLVDKGVLIHAS